MATTTKNPLLILIIISVLIFISIFVWNKFQVDNSEEITPIAKIEKPIKSNYKKKTIHKNTKEHQKDETQEFVQEERREPFVPTKQDVEKMHKSYNFNVYLSRLQTPEQLVEALLKYEESGETQKANKVIDKLLLLYPDYELPNH